MTEATVEITPETLDLDGTEAPATLAQECTREVLLRPPDWRYQAACQYLFDIRNGVAPIMPNDKLVQYLIRGLKAFQVSMTGRGGRFNGTQRYALHCWHALGEAIYYGVEASGSAMSTMIDTCLIKGWTAEEARLAGCPLKDTIYELYSKLFFDLSGARTLHAWMQDFVFSPAMGNNKKLRARLMAFYGDGRDGVNANVAGALSDNEAKGIKKLMQNERQKQLLDYVLKQTRLPLDIYAGIMEGALKSMSEHDFQEHMRDREDAGSASIEELTEGIEVGVRAYSQHEIEEANATGIDFASQYTKVIIGNNDHVKENAK